ncbi:uncharacterized protein LOC142615907 [Castanea sativa]|uniref:uncharacterized protein LOC142615907 n=1 Tax=Castanea sativa TaxID=21020 RepID=UPI003F6523C5
MPRTAIKGQILADFVAEFTDGQAHPEDAVMTIMSSGTENITPWEVYTDGASNRKGAGVGVVLISPEKLVIEKSLRLGFPATNNEAEYEALLVGTQMVRHLGGKVVRVFCDSRLVVGQVNGEFEAKDERMKSYLKRVQGVLGLFDSFKIQQVPRGHNSHADSLAMLATSLGSKLPRMVMVEDLLSSSLTSIPAVRVHSIHVGPSWMDPIIAFLQHGILPEDGKMAEKIRRSAPRYWLSGEQKLYRRSYAGPYLLCVHPEAVEPLLEELHEGGNLNPLSSPWPFAKWGLDIVGPFPRATGNRRWLIVGTDYFTKWVEAEPLANIRDVDAKRFIWKNIITRFGVPHTLISDNGLQFDSKVFRRYCAEMGIRNGYSTPYYPQGNGQAEATNKVILAGLKKRLDDAKGGWVEELPHSDQYDEASNHDLMNDCLNTIEESREIANVKMGNYHQKLKQTYDKGVRTRPLVPGDLVLRKVVGVAKNPAWGKLGPNWEGPYRITSMAGVGAYRLEDLDGGVIPRPWNWNDDC